VMYHKFSLWATSTKGRELLIVIQLVREHEVIFHFLDPTMLNSYHSIILQ